MGIAEIQAAFAANAAQPTVAADPFGRPPAPAPFAQQLAPAQPTAAFPASPLVQPTAAFRGVPAPALVQANPFAAAAQVVPFQVGPGVAPAFAFTPPAGFQPTSAPPINPVGERASLNTAAPLQPAVEAPAAPVEPIVEAPKAKRQRKPKADAVLTVEPDAAAGIQGVVDAVRSADAEPDFTTEQLVQFLVDRGYAVRLERAS